jgi:hypothetical protein
MDKEEECGRHSPHALRAWRQENRCVLDCLEETIAVKQLSRTTPASPACTAEMRQMEQIHIFSNVQWHLGFQGGCKKKMDHNAYFS